MKFDELNKFYHENYSIGYMGDALENKLALISLICYVTYKAGLKQPDVTYYRVVKKISEKMGLTEEQIKALAIVCEDFGYGCKDFPTFGLKGSEIVSKIRELLAKWLPF